jgi:hypothetical protein
MANRGEAIDELVRDPRRWAVTAGALAIFSLGWHIPLPGLEPDASARLFSSTAVVRPSIFMLGVVPIVGAAALVEMARLIVPPLARWSTTKPGWAFRFGVVLALVGSIAFLIWLADAMTRWGAETACCCCSWPRSSRVCRPKRCREWRSCERASSPPGRRSGCWPLRSERLRCSSRRAARVRTTAGSTSGRRCSERSPFKFRWD